MIYQVFAFQILRGFLGVVLSPEPQWVCVGKHSQLIDAEQQAAWLLEQTPDLQVEIRVVHD